MKRFVVIVTVLVLTFTMMSSAFAYKTMTTADVQGLNLIATVGPVKYTGNNSGTSPEGTSSNTYIDCAVISTIYFNMGAEYLFRSPVVYVEFQKKQSNNQFSTLGGISFDIDVPNNMINAFGDHPRYPSASGSAYYDWDGGNFSPGTFRFMMRTSSATTAFSSVCYGFTSHDAPD